MGTNWTNWGPLEPSMISFNLLQKMSHSTPSKSCNLSGSIKLKLTNVPTNMIKLFFIFLNLKNNSIHLILCLSNIY
nr:hypothetical protein Iba_scaffold2753CG0990 [Ipomoea batatas]GME05338.1 hypothetical protein Iba_scaffold2754CG0010 [Ipomoea batatas]